jgi:LemA protein
MNTKEHAMTQSALAHRRGILAVLLFALFAALAGCQKYDVLVEKDAIADQRWADLQAQLQRRYDLVPNLVATVRGSAQHEERTLSEVIEARSNATSINLSPQDLEDPARVQQFQQAQDQLSHALSRLLVVNESYPQLQANAAYHDLMVQLEGTENRILRAREQYNAAARDYNAELNKIGGAVLNRATNRHFRPRVYFTTANADVQTAPRVQF